ncbi:MAG: Hpt domain-containing protein, partial [Steroidobacteraceae bacterium]
AFARTVQISTVGGTIIDVGDPGATLIEGGAAVPPVIAPSRTSVVRALAENADPELVKLFIEEAHEELAKIQRHFPAWDQNPMDRESLVTVRRSFHTLKGSGRMVGARELGEFAWSIENLLNRILDNTLTRTPAILTVLREAVAALPELVEQLETGRKPRVDVDEIAARAHALAAGRQPTTTARAAAVGTRQDDTAEQPASGSTATVAIANLSGAPKPLASPGASAEVPVFAGPASTTADAGTIAETFTSTIAAPAPGFAAAPVAAGSATAPSHVPGPTPPAFTRPAGVRLPASSALANHTSATLPHGASANTGAPPTTSALPAFANGAPPTPVRADPLPAAPASAPAALRSAPQSDTPPPDAAKPSGLDDGLREIYARETNTHIATVRAYLEREAALVDPHVLPEDVYRACHTLSGSSKMAQARHGTRIAEPLDQWLRRAFSSGLGLTQQDLTLLADCMRAMESVATHLDEPTGYFVTHWELQERIAAADTALGERIAAATAARAAQEVSADEVIPEEQTEEAPEDAGDFDPEVAAIFTDEATELIEAFEHALSDWRCEPASAEYRLGLKRPLHTLKGGARMAGITAMGDLSHELETLVMQVDNGSVAPNEAMFEVVQASLDELARMRELVANGRRVSPARAMIVRIQSLSRPKAAQFAAAPAPRAAAVSASSSAPDRAASPGPASATPFFLEPVEPAHAESATDTDKFGAELGSQLASRTPPQIAASAPAFEQPAQEPFELLDDPAQTSSNASPGFAPSSQSPQSLDQQGEADSAPLGEADAPFEDGQTADSGWPSADANIPDAQPSPAQSWLKESPPAPWAAGLSTGDPDPNRFTDPSANADAVSTDAANANALLDIGAEAHNLSKAGLSNAGLSSAAFPSDTELRGDTHGDDDANDHADSGPHDNLAAGMIVVEEPAAFDALPVADASAPDIERLGATGVHGAPIEQSRARAPQDIAQPSAPSLASAVAKSVSISFERRSEPRGNDEGLVPPQPVPPGREPVATVERQEMARVDAELLDQLLNISGEASIARSRLEQQLGSFDFNLGELSRTVTRLKEQLRSLEIETEAQILHRHEDEGGHRSEFDPLELDRYSSIQQFSRALAETANDVASIQQLLENLAKDTQTLLQQQARTITELQNGLMRTRMVPFQRHVQRLARIVRQAASDTGKRAELIVEGASGELDRQVLERMLPPFEHMLRNAVVHGIEKPEERIRAGKPEAGRIVLELHREGAEVMVRLTDDGGGMNLKAIRAKGQSLGLIAPDQVLSDEDAMQLILEPGFSTAGAITQQAGRGVGMDVVATEIKRLGGALHMETKAGEGTVFTIRLPFTLAISHALVVRTGEEFYALPLPTVEGVLRLSKAEVTAHLGRDASAFDYGGQKYHFQHLATFVGLEPSPLPEQDVTIPVVLVRAGEHSTGLVADELVGSR